MEKPQADEVKQAKIITSDDENFEVDDEFLQGCKDAVSNGSKSKKS